MTKKLALLMAVIVGLLASAMPTLADTVKLKDGSTLEGKIIEETDSYVFLRISVGSISTDKLI